MMCNLKGKVVNSQVLEQLRNLYNIQMIFSINNYLKHQLLRDNDRNIVSKAIMDSHGTICQS